MGFMWVHCTYRVSEGWPRVQCAINMSWKLETKQKKKVNPLSPKDALEVPHLHRKWIGVGGSVRQEIYGMLIR